MLRQMMGMMQECRTEQRQEQTQKQRLEQRQSLRLSLRMEMLLIAHPNDGISYSPKACCPKCYYRLSVREIIKGFSRDPFDINTTCPKCKERFTSKMSASSLGGSIEMPFYCPDQTLQRMKDRYMDHLSPKKMREDHREVYASAIFHFGNLREAFKLVGIDYKIEEQAEYSWKDKAKPFFGKISDKEIAKAFNVSCSNVGRVRRGLKIDKYRPLWDDEDDY